ncbi:MAG: ABC transporter ATP-binding protein, partial [Deltaproteobacteria bacterium]
RPFEKMTVFDNLLVAALHGGHKRDRRAREAVQDTLDMLGLSYAKNQPAGGLPLLDRKCLELGRALATDPELILLDEVAAGLTEMEAERILKMVKEIQRRGITIVWIEHIMAMMSEGVDRLLAIAQGRWLNCGNPSQVMNSKEVIECYLGAEEE